VAEGARPAALPAAGAAALLVAATALAHATSFAGAFQFDDWNVIVDEPRVATLQAWWRAMPGIRPLLKLTFALDRELGLGLPGFHAVNLLLHLGAALLALALLRRLEGWFTSGDGAGPAPGRAGPAALLGALLFALHPVQTEAVAYLSGRSASLAALLALGSLLAWLEGRAHGRPWLTHGLSPLLLAASLGARETAAALPLALLLLAAAGTPGVGGRGAAARPGGWRRALADTAVHWLVLAAAATAFLASPAYRAMLVHAGGLRPPLQNLRVHLDGLAWLAGQVLRPDLLLADPGPAAASGPWWPAALTALALAALLAGALAALLLGGRAPLGLGATPGRRAAALALLWWLLWLPPSGWLLPRPEAANDRQAYLALLGPAWLLGRWVAAGLASTGVRRTVAAVLTAALLLGLGGATARRNLVYADEVTFWADVARKAPENGRAWNNLGLALSAGCRLEEAAAAFQQALALDPDHPRARVNLWLLRQGEPPGERPGQAITCPRPGGVAPP
jgi:tetratricopeptide (TPR) repeat protein